MMPDDVQLIQQVYDAKYEIEANNQEIIRLQSRLYSLHAPITTLIESNNSDVLQTKTVALNMISKVAQDANMFITKYNKKSAKNFLSKMAFRNTYSDELTRIHLGLSQCINDLSLGISVDVEKQRREDLDDLKCTFNSSINAAINEIQNQNDSDSVRSLKELKEEIERNQQFIVEVMEKRQYRALDSAELSAIQHDTTLLLESTTQKLDEITSSLNRVEITQHYMVSLLESGNMTKSQEKQRTDDLEKLHKSNSDFTRGKFSIASGHFGDVYYGLYGKQKVAIKVLRNQNKPLTPAQKRGAETEVLLMRYLESPSHVVACYGFVPDLKEFWIVLELAPYGSLWEVVSNHESLPVIPPILTVCWMSDLIDALAFIHSRNITHKDLKCENALVFSELRVKICDFGLAKKTDTTTTQAGAGTGHFRAPEVRMGHHSSQKSDIFSFAMTSVQLMTRAPPREENAVGQVNQAISDCFSKQGVDSSAVDMVTEILLRCASTVSGQRPTSVEVSQQISEALELLGGDLRDTSSDMLQLEKEAKQLAAERWISRFKSDQGSNTPPVINWTSDSAKFSSASGETTVLSMSSSLIPSVAVSNAERDNAIATLSQWMLTACPDIEKSDNLHYCNLLYDHKAQTVDKAAKAATNPKLPDWLSNKLGISDVDAIALVEAFEVYLLNKSVEAISQLEERQHGEEPGQIPSEVVENILLSNGARYSGCVEVVNDETVAHGKGKMTYNNGDIYEGHIVNNLRHGEGIYTQPNVSVYEGEFKNDIIEGHGIYKWTDGDVYDGEWKDGRREGRGVLKYANGDVYDGEYKNNKREGHGILKWTNGNVYEGEWKNDSREGHGILKYAFGSVYEGDFKNDKVEGHGVYKWTTGELYDGEWKDGRREGRGVHKNTNGNVYEGDFKNDNREGRGIIKFANGDVYEGEYKNNKRDGHGINKYANGNVYDGEFKNDVSEGRGIMTYADGDVYDGQWKNDKREGRGIYKYADGDVYEGEFKSDYRSRGTLKYANGDVYDGQWKDGLKDGHGINKYANNDVYEGEWKNDKREGRGILKNSDGLVINDGKWKDDEPVKKSFVSRLFSK